MESARLLTLSPDFDITTYGVQKRPRMRNLFRILSYSPLESPEYDIHDSDRSSLDSPPVKLLLNIT
jgi:hypothetical protein